MMQMGNQDEQMDFPTWESGVLGKISIRESYRDSFP